MSDEADEEQKKGIACPKCGCEHFEYSYGKDAPGERQRVKRCRHCGTRVLTGEVVKRVLPPTRYDQENNSVYRISDARKAM
jgi:DNA-directed RNA polymerase subunit RPC12/RpoP